MTTHDTTAEKPPTPVYWRTPEQAVIDALEQEVAELRKDAERYRWLRDVASGGDWEHIGQTTDPTNTDARIDECMAAYRAVGAA
jgi:hypothetical protein